MFKRCSLNTSSKEGREMEMKEEEKKEKKVGGREEGKEKSKLM